MVVVVSGSVTTGVGGTGAGSTGVEVLTGTLVEWFSGTLVVVVAVNIGVVAVRLTGTGTGTGTATAYLSWDCFIMRSPALLMHPPLLSIFFLSILIIGIFLSVV